MASILAGFFKPASFAVQASTNGFDGEQRLTNLAIEKIEIKFRSTLNRHKMEDGSTEVDSRIIQPTTIDVTAISPDADTLTQLKDILNDRQNWYLVSMRGMSIDYMMADGEGIRQTPEMVSANQISFRFEQLLFNGQGQITPYQAGDSSVLSRGITSLKSVASSIAPTVTSLYNNVTSKIDSIL